MTNLFNIEIEKSIISSLLSIDHLLAESGVDLQEEDFYANRNQTIFGAIKSLHNSKLGYDATMVLDFLEKRNQLETAGGEGYLTAMLNTMPASKFNFVSHVNRLKDLSQRRRVQALCSETMATVENSDKPIPDLISNVIGELSKSNQSNSDFYMAGDLCQGFLDNLNDKVKGKIEPFIDTGFPALNNKINLNPTDLMIIAARPSMGKSTLAQNILLYITEKTNKTGVFFSTEMARNLVMNRLISAVGTVNLGTIMSGGANNKGMIDEAEVNKGEPTVEEWGGITSGIAFLKDLPLIIDDKSQITVGEMRAKLNKIRHDKGEIGVVVVDYIQILGGISNSNNRVTATGDVTNGLKNIAKDFNCPVIALSQLNRGLESRPDKRPMMSDLRESGEIEQIADQIVAIYRDEVYNEKTEHKGVAEMIILKNRNGVKGTVRLGFEGKYSRFTNLMPSFDNNPFLEASQ